MTKTPRGGRKDRHAMTDEHPDPQLLERFMRDEVDVEERRAIVRHLLTGCDACAQVTRRVWGLGEAWPLEPSGLAGRELRPASYGEVFRRLMDGGARGERWARKDRREAPERLAELLALPAAERLSRIEADAGFRTPALCELLIEDSRRAADPALALERAEDAIDVADRLDARRCGATLTRSLQGRAWICLGIARRRAGDARGAEAALDKAEPALREGMDVQEQAELLELKARLLADRGAVEDAERLLERALLAYRAFGERHLEGRVLVQKGTILGWSDGEEAVREGIRLLRQGLALLDERREPLLVAFALHRLALLLADSRGGEEALRTLGLARPIYERHGDGPNLVRLRHLEGKIEEGLGRTQAAEAAYLEARQGFLVEDLGIEAAVALLDLAMLYRREGRAAEVRGLAEDLLPIMRARDIRQGAAAALLFFRDVVDTGNATPELLAAVSGYLAGPRRVRRPVMG
jgi:tetratricopeptide (TPR) repeat protein